MSRFASPSSPTKGPKSGPNCQSYVGLFFLIGTTPEKSHPNYTKEALFEQYSVEAAAGVINLEVPIGSLNRALRSAARESTAQLRLTKKGPLPLLALTVRHSSWTDGRNVLGITHDGSSSGAPPGTRHQTQQNTQHQQPGDPSHEGHAARERETVITQEIPVRVLHPTAVENLHQPRCPEPEVHIVLPPLIQLKAISERFTKLALSTTSKVGAAGGLSSGTAVTNPTSTATGGSGTTGAGPKLELSANMHGSLKLGIATDALRISSVFTGLANPTLDPAQLSQGALEEHPSERMRALGSEGAGDEEAGWAKVRIDAKDWNRVLSVGRLSPKVVAGMSRGVLLVSHLANSLS